MCEFSLNDKWRLLYRASFDGFEAASFHSKCDEIPNTLAVMKSRATSSHVFGGFTASAWSSPLGEFRADPHAFLFSLVNAENKPCKFKVDVTRCENSIFCHANMGPSYGRGDLLVSTNAHLNSHSYSDLGCSYKRANIEFGSRTAQCFLAGSHKFQLCEIEVYARE